MIGTIRKHSKWLWIIIIVVTIITFVFWMNPGGRNGGGGVAENLGSIEGQKITQSDYLRVRNEVAILYFFQTFRWPDRDPNFTEKDWEAETYRRLFLIHEADKLGIHVDQDALATAAKEVLSSPRLVQALGVNGPSVPLDAFVRYVLQPKGLTAADFENYVHTAVMIDQLRQAMGLSGRLIPPQEMMAVYQHEYQERSAQIVFFSETNYLASVPVTPAAVGQFYTNYLAQYRLPDRVSVSYVAFPITNFMAEAKRSITNLNDQVDGIYSRYGTNAVPDAKSPEDAKAKIADFLIRQQALVDARQQADNFANTVFNMEPVRPENLATVAKQKGLAVQMTAPFSKEYGPKEFTPPPDFTKAAFGLSTDDPLAGPIAGRDAVYVIALAKQFSSEIPPLSQIRDQVTQDYRVHEAVADAQSAGTNFALKVQLGLAAGKSFSAVCSSAGLHAITLPPFSLATQDMPELGDLASLNDLKTVTFRTVVGHASEFAATDDGGFIVYVKSELPLDTKAMSANFPQFVASFRQQRETAAFVNWFERAGSRALMNTPIAPAQSGGPAR